MVVDHGSQQVVRRADRVEIAREVKVDVLHRNHLCVAAAGRAAFDSEDRAERRLTKSDHHVLVKPLHRVREADRCRRLAFARRSRVDRRDENQFAVRTLDVLQDIVVYLRLVLAVLLKVFVVDPGCFRDLRDRKHRGFLSDFNVCLVLCHVCISS